MPEEQQTGRDRLLRALIRPSRSQAVVAVLLAVLGYAAVTQVRFNEVDNTYGSLREQDLIDVLNGLAGTSQRAEAEIARLQRTRDDLLSDTGSREAALAQAQQEADTLSILAGLVPVTGPGIRVTVTEETGTVQVQTLVDSLQELRTAGAEAIQVNGQVRVVADTAVEDVPGGLLVGGQVVTSPYVIDVIGEPHTLASSGIDFPDGPRDLFEDDGASVVVDELASLDIESVVKPARPEYAEPDGAQ
ncbi:MULTISPECIES: DUF881 domain-containing protein [unclassified Nocardioides]|uniref:DUF881 domain-containing protein n=1 Tax=unclassified Nocardioides TaxID=2615069 RepID=UPI000056FCBB|nr:MULTISPECIES: DUF881 domain-containing protein [unclassified Nocardioides]ABL82218.1 protein of unknown function DUF881 [Nocardioides sp. JS614]